MAKKKSPKMPTKKTSFSGRIAFCVFAVFCVVTIVNMSAQVNSRIESIKEAEQQIAYYEAQIDTLTEELATPYDYTYIQKIARSKLSLSMPDDIIFYNDLSQ